MSARATLPTIGIAGALLALQLLPTVAFADDRRPDPASLSVMTINTYFMWDGVAPEDGSSEIDIPWRNSQLEAEEHMAAIAEVIARANPDIVNLVEIENEAALTGLNDKFLAGRGYRPYFVQGGDTFTGQDVGLLTRVDPDGEQIKFGPFGRLASHASGRRSGDQFCVYVCDRLVLPTVRDRIDDVAAGKFSLDQATRDYVRTELGFRMVQVTDGREALQVERLVQQGALASGRPFLNPIG